MEGALAAALAIAFVAFTLWVLWKARHLIWAIALFGVALIVLMGFQGLLVASPAAGLAVGGITALAGAWRFARRHR